MRVSLIASLAAVLLAPGTGLVHGSVTTVGAVPNAPPAGGGAVVGAFTIGDAAFGSVTVTAGTAITSTGGATIGNGIAGIGSVSLSGFGSDWTLLNAASDIILADEGVGLISVGSQAVVTVPDDTVIGAQAGSSGRLTVTGLGSQFITGDAFTVGISGAGNVEIFSGGIITSASVNIGDFAAGHGVVTVSGDLSRWTASGTIIAGDAGNGRLEIVNGGRVTNTSATSMLVGNLAGSVGSVEVFGVGSALSLANGLNLGNNGSGHLLIHGGGRVSTGISATLGSTASGHGELTIDGAGSRLDITGALLGNVGESRITLANGGTLATTASSTISATGRLTLDGGQWTSTAAVPAIAVQGLLQGNGTLDAQGVTISSGTPRGSLQTGAGDQLLLTGLLTNNGDVDLNGGALEIRGTMANAGAINVSGGSLRVAGAASNAASTGLITGRNALLWLGGGLTNSGSLALTNGVNDLFGDITNSVGGRIIVSGGATAIFMDDIANTGSINVTAAGPLVSAAIFFGALTGSGVAGGGAVFIEGDARPGASPGVMAFGGDLSLGPFSRMVIEIGGMAPGTQYDRVTVAGEFSRDGALVVELISGFLPAAGQNFDVFDFDAARDTGTFSSLTLPALATGLKWDTSELYTTGTISVVPEGLTFAAWAAASGIPGATPNGDHDHDGWDNATEFALGHFPPQPGSVLPNGGFFTYAEGERLRLLFTRPLDRTGLTLTVQAGDDLVTWTDLATSVNSQPFTGPGFVSENRAHPLPEPGLVEVRDVLNTSTTPRRQMRVRIQIAP